MSSAVAYAPSEPAHREPGGVTVRAGSWRLQALSVLAFAVLAMLCSLRFAALLAHPSFPRVAGIVAIATALSGGLLGSASLARRSRLIAAPALTAIALYAGLCCAGIGARELLPWHWGLLASELGRGIEALDGLWPYRGSSAQARAAVMACVAAAVIPAAALVFWPAAGAGLRRRLTALSLLLILYVTAAANLPRSGWQVQALAALGALYLWGWASRTRRAEDGRAAAWLLAGTLVSILAAGALAGGPVIDVRSWQPFGPAGAATAFDWNQTYGPLPWSTSPAVMVEVSSGAPHLWRATDLDRFDGTRFLASGHAPSEPLGIAEEPQNRRWITTSTFTVKGLASALLLSPGEILLATIKGPSLPTLGVPAPDGTLALASPPGEGVRYTTTAYAPQPSKAEMRGTRAALTPAFRPYIEFELPGSATPVTAGAPGAIAQIEASPYAGVYALARRLAAGASDDYEVAARIDAFLHHGFTYSTHPEISRFPLVTFLTGNRTGYCQQFSGAMALLLRMDGIPARVASGFLAGSRDAGSRRFSVSALDAHAWVEVFYAGIGWVAEDPTPAQPLAVAGGLGGAQLSAASLAASRREETSRSRALPGLPSRARGPHRPASASSEAAIAFGVGAALLLLAIALGWARVRRRPRDPAGGGELEELNRALRVLGLEPAAGTTLAELERRLSRSHGAEAGGYLRSLRELRYSPPGAARPPTARQRRLLRRALSTGRGPLARLRGLLALPPGRGVSPGGE